MEAIEDKRESLCWTDELGWSWATLDRPGRLGDGGPETSDNDGGRPAAGRLEAIEKEPCPCQVRSAVVQHRTKRRYDWRWLEVIGGVLLDGCRAESDKTWVSGRGDPLGTRGPL